MPIILLEVAEVVFLQVEEEEEVQVHQVLQVLQDHQVFQELFLSFR
jgi:hypothetical protein